MTYIPAWASLQVSKDSTPWGSVHRLRGYEPHDRLGLGLGILVGVMNGMSGCIMCTMFYPCALPMSLVVCLRWFDNNPREREKEREREFGVSVWSPDSGTNERKKQTTDNVLPNPDSTVVIKQHCAVPVHLHALQIDTSEHKQVPHRPKTRRRFGQSPLNTLRGLRVRRSRGLNLSLKNCAP